MAQEKCVADFTKVIADKVKALPSQYENLRRALSGVAVNPTNVYLVEYFDPIDSLGSQPLLCGGDPEAGLVLRNFAASSVEAPLRATMMAAATGGWHYIGGITKAFQGHGACWLLGRAWVNTFWAAAAQGHRDGTWHANNGGQVVVSAFLTATILPGLSTSAPATVAGAAFQANTTSLWTAAAAGVADRKLGMMPGTSPSIVAVPGGYQEAFQANTGSLWTTGAFGTRDLGLGMMKGTSPAITSVPGGYVVAFQANTGHLWVSGTLGTADIGVTMAPGTSPAIASDEAGHYAIVYQAPNSNLSTVGALGQVDTGLGMMQATSPTIAYSPLGYAIAFQANTGNLWTTGAFGTRDWGLGMMKGTSPSIAAGEGGAGIAFQANTGNLWTAGAAGIRDTGLGMMRGTSPSIAGGGS